MKWDSAQSALPVPGTGSAQVDEPLSRPHRVYITDEHGWRYDRKGNRLDARGHVLR
jgi:hypothetical protein